MSAGLPAGIGLALLAATAYNVGLILEKRALGDLPAIDVRRVPRVIVNLVSSPVWLSGFGLMLTGLACQVIVLSFAPISIVQPVLASGVALVLVLSRVVLREHLGGIELCCVAAMAVIVIALALSAAGTATTAGDHANAVAVAAVIIPAGLIGFLVVRQVAVRRFHDDLEIFHDKRVDAEVVLAEVLEIIEVDLALEVVACASRATSTR